jgi:hypothetical protein
MFKFFYIALFIAWNIMVYQTHFAEGVEVMTGNVAYVNAITFSMFMFYGHKIFENK